MQSDEFCVEYPNGGRINKRRQSTSWDNEVKALELSVPKTDRRNSHTLAQLLESTRQASVDSKDEHDIEDAILTRRKSMNSRRSSIAELSDSGITTTNSDDCVVLTQTLGTSTTYFFQKEPTAMNMNLRPSAKERGLYNFDDMIKEKPTRPTDTPRPSVVHLPPPPPILSTIPKYSGDLPVTTCESSRRPSQFERGLPCLKFQTTEQPVMYRGRTLEKQRRGDPRFNNELDRIIANRRKILEEEEAVRESSNLIRPRSRDPVRIQQRPHHYNGQIPNLNSPIRLMEELRTQIDGTGEVDRIVKEKKTTTLSSTGVPVNQNRRSITSLDNSCPPILDRPYVRASDLKPPISSPHKQVTIRVPEHQTSDICREGNSSS
ncbi:unnamed protein product [Caenorhabditis angaria]|uniref:Uncharacterized protein n=1 Tax=Caenorhabditis angaria TaxID=860376 RepID=A0A9P1J4T8_9PELO|nr:unnamed protein product [Caenorhabditis angaria]